MDTVQYLPQPATDSFSAIQSALLRPFLHLHFLPSADCRHKKYSIQSSGGRGKNSAREQDNPSAHFEQNVPTVLQKGIMSGTLNMPTRSGGSQQMRIKPWQLLTKALLTYFSVIKYKWKHPILNLAIYTSRLHRHHHDLTQNTPRLHIHCLLQ